MQYQGKLVNWNDDRGFGFVEPNGGGNRAFVHVKAFTKQGKRPENGDVIVYTEQRQGPNKFKATNVRYASSSKKAASKNPKRTTKDNGIGNLLALAYFVAILIATGMGRLPEYTILISLGLSVVSFFYYWADKRAANKGAWRVPEQTLHMLALFGGWLGAMLGQRTFRHKTSKASFQAMFKLSVLGNVVGLVLVGY